MDTVTTVNLLAYPSAYHAQIIRHRYQQRVIQSLYHIAQATHKIFRLPLNSINERLQLFKSQPASPLLFALNATCISALQCQKSIYKIPNALNLLLAINPQQLKLNPLLIANLKDIPWLKPFWEEICGISNQLFQMHREKYPFIATVTPLIKEDFLYHKQQVKIALELIRSRGNTEYYDEITLYLSHLILFSGSGITGWSSPRYLGIYLDTSI